MVPTLENAWNLLKKSEKHGILTQHLEKDSNLNVSRLTFQDVFTKKIIYIYVISKLSTPTLKAKLTGDMIAFTWK